MTDTNTPTAETIVADATQALAEIDANIAAMRQQKAALGSRIAAALNERMPLVRIVSAAKGRKSHTNGDTE